MAERKQMTVAELKEKIKDLPDDMVVFSEGCDCVDKSTGIQVDDDGLTITR